MIRGIWRTALVGVVGLVYIALLLPTIVIVGAAFNAKQVTTFPPTSLSTQWFVEALHQFGPAFKFSLILATVTVVITMPIAVLAALAIVRYSFPGRNALQTLLLSPLLVPSLLVGVALLGAFVRLGFQGTFGAMLATHAILTLPYAVRTNTASLQGIDPAVEESATTLGARPIQTLFRVTVPLMSSGIVAGALFAFLVSLGEVNASVFVAGPSTMTLPIAIFSYLQWDSGPVIAATSVLQIGLIALITVIMERFVGLNKAFSFG